jgi:MoxR-like ATPase
VNATEKNLVGTIVKVTKDGSRYRATSTNGEDFTDMLESYQMAKAYEAKSALKATEAANGLQWRKVSMAEFEAIAKDGANQAMNQEMDHGKIVKFLTNAPAIRPQSYKMSDLKWRFAVRAAIRGKNMMVTGPQGCGKTVLAFTLAEVLDRPLFNIPLGSTQDPRSVIVGNTHFKDGEGTFVAESYFVNAIKTPNAIVLLDELTRAHPDAWNLLMPVLDYKQRFLRIDEAPDTPTIEVAPGVTFIATANIGHTFTATRTLDAALMDRFTVVEVEPLDRDEEYSLLKDRFPTLHDRLIQAVVNIANDIRRDAKSNDPKVSNIVSTRMTIEVAELLYDGFTLDEAVEVTVYPAFSDAGGTDSERTFVKSIVQKHRPTKLDDTKSPFTLNDPNGDDLPWG